MNLLGLYEKAIPRSYSIEEKLLLAKDYDFDFLQLSFDEQPERLERLDWSESRLNKIKESMIVNKTKMNSISVSANRKYPLGSSDKKLRDKGVEILLKAIDFSHKLGVRNILVAGYDVFYEERTLLSRTYYIENLKKVVEYAASKQVMLSIETMDAPFTKSISSVLDIKKEIPSPWLQVYPDLGNLTAWVGKDIDQELEKGIAHITEIHFKDAISVESDGKGKFRDVPFGTGDVNFYGCLYVLKKLNYTGPFVVEMWSETSENFEEEILVAKEFLERVLKETNYK